ncbi:DUF4251 domain-containing protein [Confluentibacter sediminis]|uniref:DUF4251 domain-containing protein n=1 Tax=Confluentibacter sediminis TaxID=2219045 RepID=UPI000DAE2516|nr:DUF4251 domain-containing protein [Confluentibacter sediminis]
MKNSLLISIIVTVFLACGSSSQKQAHSSSKELDTMIKNQSFEITSHAAQPLMTAAMQQLADSRLFTNGSTAGNINITSHTNYLRMKNDSVMAILPFYGERQFGGGYNSPSGIEFEGVPKDLQIKKGKASSYDIRFSITDKHSNTDNYQVYIKLYPNLSSTIQINSGSRSNIQFQGNVHALDSIH